MASSSKANHSLACLDLIDRPNIGILMTSVLPARPKLAYCPFGKKIER